MTLELRMVKNHAFILVENNTGFYFTLATRNQNRISRSLCSISVVKFISTGSPNDNFSTHSLKSERGIDLISKFAVVILSRETLVMYCYQEWYRDVFFAIRDFFGALVTYKRTASLPWLITVYASTSFGGRYDKPVTEKIHFWVSWISFIRSYHILNI